MKVCRVDIVLCIAFDYQFGSRPISIHVNIDINLGNGRLNIYVSMVDIVVNWPIMWFWIATGINKNIGRFPIHAMFRLSDFTVNNSSWPIMRLEQVQGLFRVHMHAGLIYTFWSACMVNDNLLEQWITVKLW